MTNFPFTGDPIVNPSRQAPEGYNWSFDLRFPIYTGGFNRSRIQQSVYQHRVGDRGSAARRTANGTRNPRRVSRRDLGDLARARVAPGGRVEPAPHSRHGSGVRGRYADDGRRARRAKQLAPRRDDLLAQPLRLLAERAALKQAAGSLGSPTSSRSTAGCSRNARSPRRRSVVGAANRVDQCARRAARLEAEHANLAAVLAHRFAAGDLLGAVVATLHEHVRQYLRRSGPPACPRQTARPSRLTRAPQAPPCDPRAP